MWLPVARLAVLVAALGCSGCVDRATENRVRANAYLRAGDPEEALAECERALAERPHDAGLLILKGKALFEVGRLEEAQAAYEAALAGRTDEPRALADAQLGLAMVACRLRDWATARARFEALVAINPKDVTSHLNVARVCLELKDLACAVTHGETAGHLQGDDETVLFTLGTIYSIADRLREAELTFAHICDVVPRAATCPYGLALVHARRGDKGKALEQLGEAIDRKLPNPERIANETGFASLKDEPAFQALARRAAGAML